MKKSRTWIPVIIFFPFLPFLFNFFDTGESSVHNSKSITIDTFTVVDSGYNYSARFTLNGNVVVFISDNDRGQTEEYIDNVFGFSGVTYPNDFIVEYPSDPEIDLYMITNGEGNSETLVPVALQFDAIGGTTFNGTGEPKNSCNGNPCSCCRFLKNIFGKVYGCECSTGGACTGSTCNHTITE